MLLAEARSSDRAFVISRFGDILKSMSYNYRIINERPRHFLPLTDGATPWADVIHNATVTVTSTLPTSTPALVAGGGNSFNFTASAFLRLRTRNIFLPTSSVESPFSLEAWFKPVNNTAVKTIVGHSGTQDGILWDGESIAFVTSHGAAGVSRAEYFPSSDFSSFHVVGVHTAKGNELYVNGELVGYADLSLEQLATPYDAVTGPDSLYIGVNNGSAIIDAVAVYDKPLTTAQVKNHFAWGRQVPDFRDIITTRSGTYWDFTDQSADVAVDASFTTRENWQTGQHNGVQIVDDVIYPLTDAAGAVQAGTWTGGIILNGLATKFDGSKIDWDSDGGVTVQTSVNNGTTWTTAIRGREVPGISTNFTTAGKSLQVRVNFPAADPIAKVRSLSIKLYRSRDVQANGSGTPAVFMGKVSLADRIHQPIENDDKMGVHLYDAYALVSPQTYRSIDFWVRYEELPSVGENQFVFDSRSQLAGGSGYFGYNGTNWFADPTAITLVNGVRLTFSTSNVVNNLSVSAGQLIHVVVMYPSDTNRPITLNQRFTLDAPLSNFSIGPLSTYPSEFTVAQAQNLYKSYLGAPMATFTEDTNIVIKEATTDPVRIYAFDWSLASST